MAENTPPLPEVHLTHSPAIGAIGLALAKAQGVIESAPKDHTAEVTMKSGGKYTYSYADLAGVWDAGRGPLSANELALTQAWTLRPDGLAMTTLLIHSSGEWVRGEMAGFPVPDRTPQGVGTSVTYARRYNVGAMVGVVSEEDDDGGNGGKPKRTSSERPSNEGTAGRGGATPSAPNSAPTVFPNFGKAKGEPIKGAAVDALEFHLGAARKSLADPDKAKWHARDSALIGAIEAELARQHGAVPAPPPGDKPLFDPPTRPGPGGHYAEALKVGAANGWPEENIRHFLKAKRGHDTPAKVTAEDVAALRALVEPPPEPGAD